jgi:hypothetical protein
MSGVLAGVIACGLAVLLHETRDDARFSPERAVATALAADLCVVLQPALFGDTGGQPISARNALATGRWSVGSTRDARSANAVLPSLPYEMGPTGAMASESRRALAVRAGTRPEEH